MGMNMNPAGSGLGDNYNAGVIGEQSLPPKKKKEGLPAGQIAASVGAGLYAATGHHIDHSSQKSLYAKLSKLDNLDGLNNTQVATFVNDLGPFEAAQIGKANPVLLRSNKVGDSVEASALQNTKAFLSKMDLDNTAKHVGKNIGVAALVAGAAALGYGVMRALFQPKKDPPPAASPTPTA
jgi:hypothetical protein